MKEAIKPWMLPIAMVIGMLFHDYMDVLAPTTPWFIFAMLLLTFCKVDPKQVKLTRLSLTLLSVQILGALAVYFAFCPLNHSLAQGLFICVICPTATAAPVIVGMLGGSVERLAAFSIVSNISVALLAPVIFTFMGAEYVDFRIVFMRIALQVMPLIGMPLIVAFFLRRFFPKVHSQLAHKAGLSFYLWAISLIIVVGRAVSFVMAEPAGAIPMMLALALGAGVICLLLYVIGRRAGAACGDRVAAAQGLMQKNTILAIWLATTFLNPISSVAPAAYIFWQNTLNSWQLYQHRKK